MNWLQGLATSVGFENSVLFVTCLQFLVSLNYDEQSTLPNRKALKAIKSAMNAWHNEKVNESTLPPSISHEEKTVELSEEIVIFMDHSRKTMASSVLLDSDGMEVVEQDEGIIEHVYREESHRSPSLLLSVPGEIRNNIWRYLLLTKYARELDPKRNLVIYPSILATCRQIYQETSSILWRENHWIVISETWKGILPCTLRTRGGLPFQYLDNLSQLKCPAPALVATISFAGRYLTPEFRRIYAFAYDRYFLVQICICFWKYASRCTAEASLSLMPHVKETSAMMQDLLLQPFTMLRGVKRAIINGAASMEAGRFLKSVMESQVSTYQEVYRIIQAYKSCGDDALLRDDFRAALRIYHLGLRTASDARIIAGDNRLGGQNMNSTFSLLAINSETFSNTAFAFYMIGDYKTAIAQVGTALGFAGISEESRALAHYRRGLAYMASNQDFMAAMDFFYAKDLKPGYPGVTEHITTVEKRLGFRIGDDFAPLLRIKFPDVGARVWRGDPRLVDGPDGWGRTDWNGFLMALSLNSQGREQEPER